MSQQSNLVGQTLGQYQIVELVGEGGMATIYKAWQPSLKRYVAIKVLAPRLSNESEFLKRFHQEAVAAANLKHTHIVTVYDVGVEGDYHYMAMEFIEGTSLQERLRSGQAFTLDEVVDVVSQVGSALDYAHQRGFIHRDIKPANILIDTSGRAVLTDFGIVKALSESGVTSALTQAGTIVGTPQYMSPEQVKDEPLDHRSDLYSLGIVCFEMLSGQVPFDGTTTHAILYAQVNTPPPPLRKFAGLEVPAPVEAAMNKMLAKDRDSRYDSAGEFARDLTQAVAGVWPAGIGGETAVVGHMGSGTAVAGGAAGGVTVPATKQPAGPPTPPPAAWQPVGLPAPPPTLAPARRRRSPLVLEVGIAAAIVLVLGAVVAALLLSRWLPLRGAQEALAAGDYARAVEGFNQVLERNPDHEQAIEGLLEAADNLFQAGQFDAAIAAYERVERVKPDEARVLQGLGQAYEAKGEWEQAAGWYEKWTQVTPGDANAFLALGNAQFHLGAYERAAATYERAASLGASSAEMNVHLGLAYFELARYDKAAERLQEEASQHPDDFQLQRALGVSLYAQGQTDQAIEYLNKAAALGAGRSGDELRDVYYVLGGCYFVEQGYAQAASFYEQAQALDPEGKSAWAGEARSNLSTTYVENAMKDVLLDLDFSNIVTEGDRTYAIARTGQKMLVEGPMRWQTGLTPDSQALFMEQGTWNYIINPSFELQDSDNTLFGWSPIRGNPGVVTQSDEHARFGGWSARQEGYQGLSQPLTNRPMSVWTISAYVWIADNTDVDDLSVRVYSGDELVAIATADKNRVGEWQRLMATTQDVITPTRVFLGQDGVNLGEGSVVYWDGVQFERLGYATTYADGDQGVGYRWEGTPHQSTSRRMTSVVRGDPGDSVSIPQGTLLLWISPTLPYDTDVSSRLENMYFFDTSSGGGRMSLAQSVYVPGNIVLMPNRDRDAEVSITGTLTADVWATGKWHMLAATYDQPEGQLALYVDGVPLASVNTGWGTPLAWDEFLLGSANNGQAGANAWYGSFTTFSRALRPAEIAVLYNAKFP